MDFLALQQLAVSFGLGLLLGLERERSESSIAGVRTFPFISLFGTICAQIGVATSSWIIPAGLLAVTAIITFANYVKMKSGQIDAGTTTEFAALLIYSLGALLVVGSMESAIVVTGIAMILLHLKAPLHRTVAAIGAKDMRAIIQFVIISMIILPVLPQQNVGPYEVWNPFKIWLLVVFIVAISLIGYVAYKIFGTRAGVLLSGIIGGAISSTATTVSSAKRCSSQPALAPLGVMVIMTASCMSLVRVLVEIAVVAPKLLAQTYLPLGLMLLWIVSISAAIYSQTRHQRSKMPEQKNPAELKSAILFALLYAVILWGVEAAKDQYGAAGLYVISMISGLTDMDAITLSTANMVNRGEVEASLAWRLILAATMSNMIFKLGAVMVVGSAALAWRTALAFAFSIAGGLLLVFFWPS